MTYNIIKFRKYVKILNLKFTKTLGNINYIAYFSL